MPKINHCPVKDPEPDGSILTTKEWKSYALKPNEECMYLLAYKLESITDVQPPYLTTFKPGEIKLGVIEKWTPAYEWKALSNTNSIALGILVVENSIALYFITKIKCLRQV